MDIDLTGKAVTTLRLPTTSYSGVPIETVFAQEGDMNSRVLKIQIYDSRGTIDLTPYDSVKLSATATNGDILVVEGEIVDGFGVCELSNTMLAVEGKLSCNVLFVKDNGEDEDIILTSKSFYIIVSKTHGGNGDITSDESYNLIVQIIENAGNSNAEIVHARVGKDGANYDYLKQRLDAEKTETENELAEIESDITDLESNKADITYVDTQISSVGDGSPKGTYTTLGDLETAYPEGEEGIYVVAADGHWYYWNGTAWTDGGVYQATGIADESVDPTKVSFTKRTYNLINPFKITNGYNLHSDGTLGEDSSYRTSDYFSVEELDNIMFSVSIYRGCFFDNTNTVISVFGTNIPANTPIEVPEGAITARASTKSLALFYGWSGNTIKPYMPYYYFDENAIALNERGLSSEQYVRELVVDEKYINDAILQNFSNNRAAFNFKVNRFIPLKWKRGSINGATGIDEPQNTNRTSSIGYTEPADKLTLIPINTAYKYSYKIYNKTDKSFVGNVTYVTTSTTILYNPNYVYRFTVARTDDAIMSDEEIKNIGDIFLIGEGEYSQLPTNIIDTGRKYVGIYGCMGPAPRNSLQAIKMSKLAGAWGVELDIQITADNDFVLYHSDYLSDDTDETIEKLIIEYTVDEIKAFNLTSGYTNRYSQSLKVPTLDEALYLCKELNLIPHLDLKDSNSEIMTLIVSTLIEKLSRHKMLDKAVIVHSNKNWLQYIRSLSPSARLSVKRVVSTTTAESDINVAKQLGGNLVMQPEEAGTTGNLPVERVEAYHKEGFDVKGGSSNAEIVKYCDFIHTTSAINEFRPTTKYWATLKTIDAGLNWTVENASPNQVVTISKPEGLGYDALGLIFSNLDWNCMYSLNPTLIIDNNINPALRINAMVSDITLKQLLLSFTYNGVAGTFGNLPTSFSFKINVIF